jgi:hypothetical protein
MIVDVVVVVEGVIVVGVVVWESLSWELLSWFRRRLVEVVVVVDFVFVVV